MRADNLFYHNHNLSVFWDPTAKQWPKLKGLGCLSTGGLCVFVDGKVCARARATSFARKHRGFLKSNIGAPLLP